MNAITGTKTPAKYQHPALLGLKDKYLNEVYSLANNVTVLPDEFLFQAGEKSSHLYLVLEGTGAIQHQVEDRTVVLGNVRAGDYISLSLCMKDGVRTAALRAIDSLSILALTENTLNILEDHVQATLFKNLERLAAQLSNRLFLTTRSGGGDRNEPVLAGVCKRLELQAELYNNAPAIKEMLAKVPRLPPYASKLSGILQETNTSTRMIVDIARQDPSLTAAVMKTINSPYYGLRHKITDFQHAVLLLGFNQIQQLIVNTGIQSTMPNTPEFRQLQFHSIVISALSFEISQIVKMGSPAMLSTIGILHDIGKSVILLLRTQHPDKDFLISQIDPNLIGPMLLKEWQLPAEITAPLEYQAYSEVAPPSALPQEHRVTLAILYIAHLCFIYLQGKNDETTPAYFAKDYMRILGCENPSIEIFVKERLFPSLAKHSANMPMAMQNLIHTALGRTVDTQGTAIPTAE
jgi:HD-like signal output (HDOD) protein